MYQAKKEINGLETFGYTGKGVTIAVLDTGCFPHQDLAHKILTFQDMVQKKCEPYDDNGHGTHVCGIIAADSTTPNHRYQGIAPGALLIPIKVLDKKGNGYACDVLSGLRWVRENKERYNIRIVNISVGSFSRRNMSENSALVHGVNETWDAGLIVVVAAGNMGPKTGTITTPGISRKVITVGCSDDHKEVQVMGNRMVDYSGRGPTSSCVCKPDLVAPGASITSCSNHPTKYATKSGTSMSTPLVSGALALLLEKSPHLTNKEVKLHLKDHTTNLNLPQSQQGWGQLNIKKLLS